jgi:Tfp pilus assembly protein PilP
MKLRTGILALGMMVGTVWAQNPDVIQDTRDTLQNVQKKQAIDQNAALAAAGQASKPAPGTPVSQSTAVLKPAASKPSTNNPPVVASPNKPAVSANKAAVSTPSNPSKSASSENRPAASKPAGTTAADKSKPAQKRTAKKPAKTVVAVKKPAQPNKTVAVEDKKAPDESKKKETREFTAAGRRDPFVSPVVSHSTGGSGCSSGKRCLAVDQIVLTGIVKSETGMIAVVVNSMNKAYFLRENDPVFNGYVVKITGDSIIFNQTIEDKLGKPFTREVTKKIITPAV